MFARKDNDLDLVLKPTRKFFDDFRHFAVKGNALDLAIGVVVGAAFGKIITSFVTDVITPPISVLLGKENLVNNFVSLSGGSYGTLEEAKAAGAVTLNYGVFLGTVFDFVFISLIIFLIVKAVARMKHTTPPPPDMRDCPFCLSAVKKSASRCAFCTSDLQPQPVEIKK